MLNPILFAVPVFLVLMAAEYAVARHRGVVADRTDDTVPCLSLGIVSQLVGVFTELLTLGVYTAVYQHAALWHLPTDAVWVWVAAWALALVVQLQLLAAVGERGLASARQEALRWAAGAVLLAASPVHGVGWLLLWGAGGLVGGWAVRAAARAAAVGGVAGLGTAAG